MPSFNPDDELNGDRAFRLVHNTFVTMFYREQVLAENLDWLRANAYQVVEVEAGRCTDLDALLAALARALDFPEYFGSNLNALNDCMSDVASGDYGADLEAAGLVLVLRGFDKFAHSAPNAAHTVIDIIATQCRNGALIGHRMMCLLQSDDPRLQFKPVGATPVLWNDAEWLNARRGI